MKRTRKLRAMGNVQAVVNRAPDLTAAAKALGVDRSTITRWLQTGKIKRPEHVPAVPDQHSVPADVAAPVPADGQAWAAQVRETYHLSETDAKLLELAVRMLTLAEDPETAAFVRIASVGRYQQLVKQLNLTADKRKDARESQPSRPAARAVAAAARPAVDPRAILSVVK